MTTILIYVPRNEETENGEGKKKRRHIVHDITWGLEKSNMVRSDPGGKSKEGNRILFITSSRITTLVTNSQNHSNPKKRRIKVSGNRNRHARTRPLARVQIPHELRYIRPVRLVKRQQGVSTRRVREGRDGQVGAREALGAVDDELVPLARGDGRVLGGEADVEAADGEVGVLDVEVVGVAHGAVREDGDVDGACDWISFGEPLSDSLNLTTPIELSLTVCPFVDRVGFVAGERRVQFLPQDVDLILQVDEEDICIAGRSPGVTSHARVAVVPAEDLLLCPIIVPVGPTHRVERGAVHGVPQMDAHGLIGAVRGGRRLPGDRGMLVGGVAVEATVPASLEADVRVIHGLQVKIVDRSWPPDIGAVIADDLADGIVGADVVYMPLFQALVWEVTLGWVRCLHWLFGSWRRLQRLWGFRFCRRWRQPE